MVASDVTAQFVSLEQYEQLMYVLGQKPRSATKCSGQEVLTLLNNFPTNTPDNFKEMLHRLQLPFKYNEKKNLAVNRSYFRDFFSYLTNIRCAVVEGQHRCELAARILQGYKLGECIPLRNNDTDCSIPEKSTLFKQIQVVLYYCQNDEKMLDNTVVKYLKAISEKIANQKRLIVDVTWHNFFCEVIYDISQDIDLCSSLFATENNFFLEQVKYRDTKSLNVKSNKIKACLHQILTHAIFYYSLFKELTTDNVEEHSPKMEDWAGDSNSWLYKSAELYQVVGKFWSKLFND